MADNLPRRGTIQRQATAVGAPAEDTLAAAVTLHGYLAVTRMSRHDLIAVGASAGGIDALAHLVRGLSPELRATVLVVLHVSEQSLLPDILSREGALAATHARDGERVQLGHIYVAPPRRHLLLDGQHLRLVHGPRENGHRPAIDPLFRSVARSRRDKAIGVLLSGMLDDGVAGLFAIKARGGIAVVQDPADAVAPSMPRTALRYADPQYCVPARDLGPLLSLLSKGDLMPSSDPKPTKSRKTKSSSSRARTPARRRAAKPGAPAAAGAPTPSARSGNGRGLPQSHEATIPDNAAQDPLRCPDCSGPLYKVEDEQLIHWRCREGHAFSPDSLDGAQSEALERALWLAIRTLKERALVARTLSARGYAREEPAREHLTERAQATERDLDLLREILSRL